MPDQFSLQPSATDAVVVWEGAADAPAALHLDALTALCDRLAGLVQAIAIPTWLLATASAEIGALLARHHLRMLPILDGAAPRHPGAGNESQEAAALGALAATGRLYTHEDIIYAVAAFDDNRPDLEAVAEVRNALSANGGRVRIGWVRRTSTFGTRPQAFDYVLDLPPYGIAPAGAEGAQDYSYSILAGELARRYAGDDMLAPTVIWAPGNRAQLAASGWVVSDISPLKIAYAVDAARRFVGNRAARGAPYWMLRAAFDPRHPHDLRSLNGLATILRAPHVPSALLSSVADMSTARATDARIAVVLHLYYPELWEEIAATLACLPERFDLFVSCPYRVASAMRVRIHRQFPDATVFGVHNLGRDVLPFLLWLRSANAKPYTYVLKLHGKKSVHIVDNTEAPISGGEEWRQRALAGLVGSKERVGAILKALDQRPATGLVAPEGLLYDQVTWVCGTSDLMATALARLGEDHGVGGRFPAGTMFWARLSALASLATLPDSALDFEREAGQVDGTLHHAYERVLALVTRDAGYETTDTGALLSTRIS